MRRVAAIIPILDDAPVYIIGRLDISFKRRQSVVYLHANSPVGNIVVIKL